MKNFTSMAAIVACLLLIGARTSLAGTVDTSGDVGAVAIPLAAGIISLSHGDRKGVAELVESYGTAVAATLALKYTVKEERPNGENNHSFPSLHASSSFAAAGYLQRRYGWVYGLPAYAVSTYVCWSRIDAREHHFVDVLTGAAIGFGASRIFTKPYKGINVSPLADKNLYGLVLTKTF
ncbi:MAG: phosphatase PAP2 family protein [Nitrospiraceae bacterium]|nr:phosphatase PAP2 family protein [Nitrospiraceae bacterium]